MAELVTARLAEDPRNRVALDALQEVVAERKVALPPHLVAAMAVAQAEDDSLTAQLGGRAACAWDIA